jgi:hypothetical protein
MPSVVSIFCGCGGLACGFKQVGFNLTYACDSDPAAVACYARNVAEHVFVRDVRSAQFHNDIAALDRRKRQETGKKRETGTVYAILSRQIRSGKNTPIPGRWRAGRGRPPAEALATWPKWTSRQRKLLRDKVLMRWSTSAKLAAQRGRSGRRTQMRKRDGSIIPAKPGRRRSRPEDDKPTDTSWARGPFATVRRPGQSLLRVRGCLQ